MLQNIHKGILSNILLIFHVSVVKVTMGKNTKAVENINDKAVGQ